MAQSGLQLCIRALSALICSATTVAGLAMLCSAKTEGSSVVQVEGLKATLSLPAQGRSISSSALSPVLGVGRQWQVSADMQRQNSAGASVEADGISTAEMQPGNSRCHDH